jgi:hypothetical protein
VCRGAWGEGPGAGAGSRARTRAEKGYIAFNNRTAGLSGMRRRQLPAIFARHPGREGCASLSPRLRGD